MRVFSIVQIVVVLLLKRFNGACSWRSIDSFCNDIMVSRYFSEKVSKKNRFLEVFMEKLLICWPERFVVRKTWDYWTKLQLALQSSLANNSTVSGPIQHQYLASKRIFWQVTTKLSPAIRLVSLKVSVEPCQIEVIRFKTLQLIKWICW